MLTAGGAAAWTGITTGCRVRVSVRAGRQVVGRVQTGTLSAILLKELSKAMSESLRVIVFVLSLAVFTGAASGQSLIDASDPEKIRNIASGYGAATLTTDSGGDPMIRGRIDGILYGVYFYGCDGGVNCRSIQLYAAWDPITSITEDSMRSWNQTMRFGTAYLDDDGGPTLSWDINLFSGVTVANLDDSFDWWAIIVKDFEEFLE